MVSNPRQGVTGSRRVSELEEWGLAHLRRPRFAEMRYLTFGSTGLRLSEFALGTMRLPHEQGKLATASTAIFDAFVESGGNVLDTADAYGDAEHLTRALVGADREHFVIGSKYTLERRDGDVNSAEPP
jgi:aryl-alcohol dehydrogenase-like predicted oxidoreductase